MDDKGLIGKKSPKNMTQQRRLKIFEVYLIYNINMT